LEPAREEVAAFARAVHADGAGEEVRLVAADARAAAAARALAPFATVLTLPFGDIWLRDTGPIVLGQGGARRAARFRFNGWGGKYELPGDESIGRLLAESVGLPITAHDWILEGGAIDVDGAGLAVTTEQCLLNTNRNPGLDKGEIEARLRADLGIERVLWLGAGLLNDHTDGHVDNLARFVAEGTLAIPQAAPDDPNAAAYADARARAEAFGVKVVPLPSPGRIVGRAAAPGAGDDDIVPASHLNLYIGTAPAAAASIASASRCRPRFARRPEKRMTRLTVAALQLGFTEDLAENIRNVSELVREAAGRGARVVLPPELFEGPYFCRVEDESLF